MIPREVTDSLAGSFCSQFPSFLIHSSVPLSGGCINHVHRLDTSGGAFCIKFNIKDTYPGMFESEAAGLTELARAGEIRVPGVISTGSSENYSYILLEFIHSSSRSPDFMEDFGRSLARLHRHKNPVYGFTTDNYMGSLPQKNREHSDWISFFIEERLERQVHMAIDKDYLSAGDLDHFKRLYDWLPGILFAEEPTLLHGDLWGGNYMVSEKGRACLIDPAVYYGHREVDLAMTMLFGGFSPDFYRAYDEEYPLGKGWRSRLDIYNLYPLLVHLNLFGISYLGSIREIITRF
jgi:fructosamine-3-kinase